MLFLGVGVVIIILGKICGFEVSLVFLESTCWAYVVDVLLLWRWVVDRVIIVHSAILLELPCVGVGGGLVVKILFKRNCGGIPLSNRWNRVVFKGLVARRISPSVTREGTHLIDLEITVVWVVIERSKGLVSEFSLAVPDLLFVRKASVRRSYKIHLYFPSFIII